MWTDVLRTLASIDVAVKFTSEHCTTATIATTATNRTKSKPLVASVAIVAAPQFHKTSATARLRQRQELEQQLPINFWTNS